LGFKLFRVFSDLMIQKPENKNIKSHLSYH
jgi:hypothetical protein